MFLETKILHGAKGTFERLNENLEKWKYRWMTSFYKNQFVAEKFGNHKNRNIYQKLFLLMDLFYNWNITSLFAQFYFSIKVKLGQKCFKLRNLVTYKLRVRVIFTVRPGLTGPVRWTRCKIILSECNSYQIMTWSSPDSVIMILKSHRICQWGSEAIKWRPN